MSSKNENDQQVRILEIDPYISKYAKTVKLKIEQYKGYKGEDIIIRKANKHVNGNSSL